MNNFFDDTDLEFKVSDQSIETEAGSLEYDVENACLFVNSINVYRRRRGIGTQIVQRLEKLATEKKISVIAVPVSPTYEAVSFWYAMNYNPSARTDKYWFNKLIRSGCDRVETPQGVIVFDKKLKKRKATECSVITK
ncbi:MAG TPA: hypothetical protein DCQ37_14575 [Desulfobacteraceae bacterium]|nr:hypothetical protein [Desulfobacteraceae bacterium]